jgi:hypothetical protein
VFSANAVSTNALTFVAITPCRLVDTRGATAGFNGADPFAGPSIAAKATLTIPVQSPTEASTNTTPAPCGVIPSIAQAYSFNLTVVPHLGGAVDYVSLWPAGAAQPFVATINDPQGAIVANAAIVPAGTPSGGISVYNDGPSVTDVVIDMNGYYTAPSDLNNNTAIGAGTLSSNTTGNSNTATGSDALNANTTGHANTANGQDTLQSNTAGIENTAIGFDALQNNVSGNDNVASGYKALQNNTGSNNTATGSQALQNNTADGNTAAGYEAMQSNTGGGTNSAFGYQALFSNTTGSYNTAVGYQALQNNAASSNTAVGYNALQSNTEGSSNTATGYEALQDTTTGIYNTAIGFGALLNITTGGNNIGIGEYAGDDISGGNSNNIDIGNYGVSTDGAASNSGVIRIGAAGLQSSTYIAGISGVGVGGSAVYVNGSGQLGIQTSSRRFKEQITDMGDTSSRLFQLRPVNFFYRPEYDDGSHMLQYGLIAEEVLVNERKHENG